MLDRLKKWFEEKKQVLSPQEIETFEAVIEDYASHHSKVSTFLKLVKEGEQLAKDAQELTAKRHANNEEHQEFFKQFMTPVAEQAEAVVDKSALVKSE